MSSDLLKCKDGRRFKTLTSEKEASRNL